MIAPEQIVDVLKNYNKEGGIYDIKISPNGCVCSQLENHINENRPYTIIVHPIIDRQILRVHIPAIADIDPNNMAMELLLMHNAHLVCGCVGVDSRKVTLRLNHACRSDDDNDPPPEVVEKLLDWIIDSLRAIEMTILLRAMLDAGIPRNCADNILNILFPEDEKDEPGEGEPGEPFKSLGNTNQRCSQTV